MIDCNLFKSINFRLFQDIFETILSEKNLIEYLHDLEDVLFDNSNEEENNSFLDMTSEEEMLDLVKNTLNSLIPGNDLDSTYFFRLKVI